jgi:hypothetical protein
VYKNGKMRPVETTQGMRGRRIKESDGGANSTMKIVRTFVNVAMFPQCYNKMIIKT